jgi:lysophospholipase L1-like esterase
MKTIMCFGDSLTWGFVPNTGARISFDKRWPGVLQAHVEREYRIIEEALNGRTTVYDDDFAPYRRGATHLPMLLESHAPLDTVILLLGGNDIQPHRNVTAAMSARGCACCITQILQSNAGHQGKTPKILLVAPPPFNKASGLMELVFGHNEKESQKLASCYAKVAEFFNVPFYDSGKHISASPDDGIHLGENEHHILGEKIADIIKSGCE